MQEICQLHCEDGDSLVGFSADTPEEVDGEDGECMFFWDNYNKIVGKGKNPQEAFENLKKLMTAKNTLTH